MKTARIASLGFAFCVTLTGAGAAIAQKTFEHSTCRAGTVSVLAKADDMIVWALDHRGVTYDAGPYQGFTQRCIGVVANIAGKRSANGWCKSVDPQTGDITVVDWVGGEKPGTGTWSQRYGTGKWKNVKVEGTYEPLGPTKPVEAGTYQNCIRLKATMTGSD